MGAQGLIDQVELDLVARAGGSFYSRARDGFFEIPKPLSSKGIGVDSLPEQVRHSKVLSGNDLGLLGNADQLPTAADVDKFMKDNPDVLGMDLDEKHKFAQKLLKQDDLNGALKVLLS